MSKNGVAKSDSTEGANLGKDHPLVDVVGSFKDDPFRSFLDAVMDHVREQRRLDNEQMAKELDTEEEARVSSGH